MTQTSPSLELPPNASIFTRLRVGLHALSILKDDQGNPHYARLLHLAFDRDRYAQLAKTMRKTPDTRRLLDERRTIPGEGVTLESLSELPVGTLGHAFAHYFDAEGITPFSFEYPIEDDADFLNKRYRETHDIHHIVTGYGIDPDGEVELQAYYFGNLGLRNAAFITFISLPHKIKTDGVRGLRGYVARLKAAYRRGRASPNILGVRFDEMWDRPVAEITKDVCAPPMVVEETRSSVAERPAAA